MTLIYSSAATKYYAVYCFGSIIRITQIYRQQEHRRLLYIRELLWQLWIYYSVQRQWIVLMGILMSGSSSSSSKNERWRWGILVAIRVLYWVLKPHAVPYYTYRWGGAGSRYTRRLLSKTTPSPFSSPPPHPHRHGPHRHHHQHLSSPRSLLSCRRRRVVAITVFPEVVGGRDGRSTVPGYVQ